MADMITHVADVEMVSPSPYASHKTTESGATNTAGGLLQRQVARALEMIEMYDETVCPPPAPAPDGKSSIAVPETRVYRVKPAKKCPKAVFQISPNTVKRKRAPSLSSASAPVTSPDRQASNDGVRVTDIENVTIVTTPRKRNGATTPTSNRKPTRDGRVTPSKNWLSNAKEKKKRKVDAIHHALMRFRAATASNTENQSQICIDSDDTRCYTFTNICHDVQRDISTTRASRSSSIGNATERTTTDAASKMRVQVGVSMAQGARAYMEDRFAVVERLLEGVEDQETSPSLLAVFDGHNGAMAAEYATTRFKELLAANEFLVDVSRRSQHQQLSDEDVEKIQAVITDTFVQVDDEILKLTIRHSKRDGSTVLLGLLVGGKMFVANLGDSRGIWARSDDEVVRVSVDHKPDLDDETQRVEEAGGKVIYSGCWRVAHDEIPLRLAISRSLGDHPLKTNLPSSCSAPLVSVTPDIQVLDIGGEDEFLVFASDGLWDRLTDEDAAWIVRKKVLDFQAMSESTSQGFMSKEALQFAANALVEMALHKRSMDNITAMVISWTTHAEEINEN